MRPLVVACALVLVLSGPGNAAPSASAYTRTHSGGGVEVRVAYAPPDYFALVKDAQGATRFKPEANAVFLASLDTHSGDLMRFDPVQNSRLRTNAGKVVAPARWEAISDSGHHRSGALLFPQRANGSAVIDGSTTTITLLISNLAGVPVRTFEWTLPIR